MEVKVIFLLTVVAATAALEPASSCVVSECKLPNCRCASTEIPGGLEPRNTPQFITVTFDDAVTVQNIQTYREVLYDRKNRNNCQIGSTFFISHEYTDYSIVNELYNEGFEVALHSISHKGPPDSWGSASYEELSQEIGDQKKQMAAFANIPESAIKGMRMPYLYMGGNNQFSVMAAAGLEYDSSWGATNSIDPGLWPYTLDYASPQECNVGTCPNATFPGLWVSPMLAWIDKTDNRCTMVDSCYSKPEPNDEDGWLEFYIRNFERHYTGNRAPFGYYIHEAHFTSHPASKTALKKFLDIVTQLYDVFVVNEHDVIEWVKNPIPVDEYLKKDCKFTLRRQCQSRACGPYYPTHNIYNEEYRLQLCTACPATYPWTGNYLGTN